MLATTTLCALGLALAPPALAAPLLVGEWHLDGDGADAVGTNPATTFGTTAWVPGVVGQALHVVSQGGGAELYHSVVSQFGTGDFTISFWVLYNGDFMGAARHEEPFTSGWDSNSQYMFLMGERNGTALTYFVLNGSGSQVIVSEVAPWIAEQDAWHHVAIGRQGTNQYMCADGALFGSGTNTARDMTGASTSYFGFDPENYRSFPGYLDEFQVYDEWIGTDGCAALYATPGANLSDLDGDGWTSTEDCDDENFDVNPGAEEVCDGIDNDCDGEIDGPSATDAATSYLDVDGDGYGDPGEAITACEIPEGYVHNDDDCDDYDDYVSPDQVEVCDGVDNDCDGDTDGADALGQSSFYYDLDGDEFGDPDNVGSACEIPANGTTNDEDCDDGDDAIHPERVEACNGVDDDCDDAVDEAGATGELTWYADLDEDTYGDPANTLEACDLPLGYAADDHDCDDSSASVFPGAEEVCNLADDDCDGTIDEAGATGESVYYADGDGDGHGDAAYPVNACFDAPDIAELDDDCDDTNAAAYPGADEYCNEVDDDCNDIVDDPTAVDAVLWYRDTDHDGYGVTRRPVLACEADGDFPTVNFAAAAGDCRPNDAASHPGADELCDLVDNDCDSAVDEAGSPGQPTWYADLDLDGYGAGVATHACTQPSGHEANADDCDDGASAVHPGATEACNDDDDDCDGQVDEAGATGETSYYLDADLDGYGDPATGLGACDPIPGRVEDGTDCDDTSDGTYPGAEERCDGERNDCDLADWSSADEDGEVWLESGGAWSSSTAQWSSGADGSPAAITLPGSGTLHVCDGTYYVNLTASQAGILEVEGVHGGAVLSGGGVGSVVSVTGSGVSLGLSGLTLEDGAGSGTPARGGGLRVSAGTVAVEDCVLQGSSVARDGGGAAVLGGSLAITGSEIVGNTATYGGGGLALQGGTVTVSDTSISANTASIGAGWYANGGSLALTDVDVYLNAASSSGGGGRKTSGATMSITGGEVRENSAGDGAGLYLLGSLTVSGAWVHDNVATGSGGGLFHATGTLTLVNPLVEYNDANYGGGMYISSGTTNCSGDSAGTYGFLGNAAGTGGGGLNVATSGTFTGAYCSFGTTTATNNAPQDIRAGTRTYDYGNEATLTCSAGRCRNTP